VSNLFLQKFMAPEFTATAKLTFDARFNGEEAGLVVMGLDYGTISIRRNDDRLEIQTAFCKQADKAGKEEVSDSRPINSSTIYFRVQVREGAICQFSYSADGEDYTPIGSSFKAREGKWIGAKVGFFALGTNVVNDAGTADLDWFRVTK